MRSRYLYLLAPMLVLSAHATPAAGPDDPWAPVSATRYAPVLAGTRSYRPVEPLPWGDINRRVGPNAPSTQPRRGIQGKRSAPPPQPTHKH